MKEIIQRRLTSNAEINKHILAKFDLQDNVKHGSTLLEEIKRAFLSEEITREEMDMIFMMCITLMRFLTIVCFLITLLF